MNNYTEIYNKNVQMIKGVGERRAKLFSHLGVHDLYDLIHFYPRTYLDFSSRKEIIESSVDEFNCVVGRICTPIRSHLIRKNMTLYKFDVIDDSAVLHITIFNNSYLADSLVEGENYFFYGKISCEYGSLQMSPQIIERYREDLNYYPVYNLTAGLSSKIVSNAIKNAISIYSSNNIQDTIPDFVRKQFGLCHEQYAITAIHSPQSEHDIEIAKKRLIFEELFLLECGMLSLKQKDKKSTSCIINSDRSDEFINELPFTLTNAQLRVIKECTTDMLSGFPMNRLIQGDVGSGKTVVSAAVIYNAIKNGFQCALMAPTELLAKQHFETLSKFFDESISIALLTGSVTPAKKRKLKESIKSGEIDLVVGTHAIITSDVEFLNLGLVVTDEQHRFGVSQRGLLSAKGKSPHVLVMSATPIPRTLSLLLYGELEVSIIDELPKGRQSISTYYVNSSYENRLNKFITDHLTKGLQAYIVCPLVDESDNSELTAAKEYAEHLQSDVFSNFSVGLLHGKMKPKEKNEIMQKFADNEIQLLVSTTVIEVGIDVPNAVIMVIKDADRFGLSQLHQLRGRVGRGKEKSYCVLVSDNNSETAKKRFEIMCKTNNGFDIADADLKIRGPGEFFGAKQSGFPKLKIANFTDNIDIVKAASKAAKIVLKRDPELTMPENQALKQAIIRLFESKNTIIFN